MTSESHTAAGPRRRPTPPGPTPGPAYAIAQPVSYVPDAYDPKQLPAVVSTLPGQFGIVHPSQRTGRSVWFVLVVILASVVAFVGWRAQQSGASDSSSGVTHTSAAGHFTARFPAEPTDLVRSVRRGGRRIVMHLSAVTGQAVVAEAELHGSIPGNPQRAARQLLHSVTDIEDSELSSVRNFQFQGSPARQGNFFGPTTGQLFTVLIVAPSVRRFYEVMAPTGPDFDALKASFRIQS